jgi:hypothetical protein
MARGTNDVARRKRIMVKKLIMLTLTLLLISVPLAFSLEFDANDDDIFDNQFKFSAENITVGTLGLTQGGCNIDISQYEGIIAITGGACYELGTAAELETALGLGELFNNYAAVDTGAEFRFLIDAQQDLDVPENSELLTGTATTERVLTAEKLVYAIEQHPEIKTLTGEPSDESVGDLVYFDVGNYDPNSVGTDHYAVVTATGTPGTYVPFLQSDGTWLIDSLATKAVITSDSDGINLTDADCGKIIYMTGNGEVGLPDCDS